MRWDLHQWEAAAHRLLEQPLAAKLALTALLVLALVLVHPVLRYYIGRAVSRLETRVKYWSHARTLLVLLGIVHVVGVWLEELRAVTLLLAGVLAGILITGKEVFLGLAGRIALATADHYKIGDRIRINGLSGDVINVGLLYTGLMEVDWHGTENQASGRVVLLPHLWLTQYPLLNSTLGHEYLWDEVLLPLPPTVDGDRALRLLTDTAAHTLADVVREAEHRVPRLGRYHAAKSPPVHPIAFARLTLNPSGHPYLEVAVRFAAPARQRRTTHSDLTLALLEALREASIPLAHQHAALPPAQEPPPQAPPAEAPPPRT